MFKFAMKNAFFGYFWIRILKSYCRICPQISLIAKFHAKIKILTVSTKDALFGRFGQQIWKKLFSYMKTALLNLSYCKVWCKNKNP